MGNITLHFPDNFGADTTQIHYIGLKGEATQVSWVEPWLYFILFISLGQDSFGCIRAKDKYVVIINLQMKRDVVATIVYELMPNPSDHKWVPCFIIDICIYIYFVFISLELILLLVDLIKDQVSEWNSFTSMGYWIFPIVKYIILYLFVDLSQDKKSHPLKKTQKLICLLTLLSLMKKYQYMYLTF